MKIKLEMKELMKIAHKYEEQIEHERRKYSKLAKENNRLNRDLAHIKPLRNLDGDLATIKSLRNLVEELARENGKLQDNLQQKAVDLSREMTNKLENELKEKDKEISKLHLDIAACADYGGDYVFAVISAAYAQPEDYQKKYEAFFSTEEAAEKYIKRGKCTFSSYTATLRCKIMQPKDVE